MNEKETALVETGLAESTASSAAEAQRIKVFLAYAPADIADVRDQLGVMLQKAGFDVLGLGQKPADESALLYEVDKQLAQADCSMHVLGGEYGVLMTDDSRVSQAKYQFERSTNRSLKTNGQFKRLVWAAPLDGRVLELEQQDFLTAIQNNLSPDVMFTNVNNAAQFIEDARTFLSTTTAEQTVVKEFDMAFISNVQDAGDCYMTVEKLGEEFKLDTLTVVPESLAENRQKAVDMIRRSKLAVVYFKEASDWAVSFVKQIWKEIGGASAKTPFLLIGEDEPRRNRFLNFEGPEIKLAVVRSYEVLGTIKNEYKTVLQNGKISTKVFCPYTGLRPFNENESIFFTGRESHQATILQMLEEQKFSMVTGSSGDGKSSLIYAGCIPAMKGGFMKAQYTKWAVADFRPERQPLRNLSTALAQQMRIRNADDVEQSLGYGFSALVDLYKQSSLYCDITSEAYINANEDEKKVMKKQAANLLILVDQFEEFFTNVENFRDSVASPVAQITVNVLIETIRIAREENLPIYVIFTMRSDYIGQCVAFRGFAELIGLSTYFVPRLKREEIQQVIQSPTIWNGNTISMRLTQRLLNDLGDGIDQLPVLQHTLHQVWTRATNGAEQLDLSHYAYVGGLAASKLPKDDRGPFENYLAGLPNEMLELYDKPRLRNVLNRHANELYLTAHLYYNKLYAQPITQADARQIIRTAFTCLTKIDENRAVRNRMSLQEITDIIGREDIDTVKVARVVNIFREQGNTFIHPFIYEDADREMTPNTVLDITHESLIRNWDKLTEWAEIENKGVQIYSDFKVQVNRWLSNDCSSKYLLNSGTYAYFNAWYEEQKPTPAWIRRYIRPDEIIPELDPMEQATQYLEDIDEFLHLSKQRIERNKRLVTATIVIISLLLLLSLIVAFYASVQREEAVQQKLMAERNAEIARQQKELAEIEREKAEVQRLRAELATIEAKQQALIAEQQKRIALQQKIEADMARQFAENQKQLAEYQKAIAEKESKIAQMQTKAAQIAKLNSQAQEVEAMIQQELSVNEKNNALILQSLFLASLAEDQTAKGLPTTGVLLALEGLPKNLSNPERPFVEEAEAALYFAVNGKFNATSTRDFIGHTNKVVFNKFSPDGSKLITTSWDKTARLWDVTTGQQLAILSGHNHIVEEASFSADGQFIVTKANDFTARVWDFYTNKTVSVLNGHQNLLTDAQISSNGEFVVTASQDATARIWDAQTGKQRFKLTGHIGPVLSATISPDNKTVVTLGSDNTARLWNAQDGTAIGDPLSHGAPVNDAVYTSGGHMLVTVSDDNTAKVWNVKNGKLLHTFQHKGSVRSAAFSHHSKYLATASDDKTVRIWNLQTGFEVAVLRGHTGPVYHVEYSPNDKRILTTAEDGTARLWDAGSHLRLAEYKGHPNLGYFATFSPTGDRLAFAGSQFSVVTYKVFPDKQELIDFAMKNKQRTLTDAERKEFFLADERVSSELVQNMILELKAKQNSIRADMIEQQNLYEALPDPYQIEIPEPKANTQKLGANVPIPKFIEAKASTPSAPQPTVQPQPSVVQQPDQHVPQKTQPVPSNFILYTVKTGDTLGKLAEQFNVSAEAIRQLNNLQSDNLLIMQQLKIPK